MQCGKRDTRLVSDELAGPHPINLVKNTADNEISVSDLTASSGQVHRAISPDDRLFVSVELPGVTCNALIDTGSNATYVSEKVGDVLSNHCSILSPGRDMSV